VTAAIRVLRAAGVVYTERPYDYEEKGGRPSPRGNSESTSTQCEDARDGGRPEAAADCPDARGPRSVDEGARPGDRREERGAMLPGGRPQHSGYIVGGISRSGRAPDADLHGGDDPRPSTIYINGGRRGFLVGMRPGDVARILSPTVVRVAI